MIKMSRIGFLFRLWITITLLLVFLFPPAYYLGFHAYVIFSAYYLLGCLILLGGLVMGIMVCSIWGDWSDRED